MTRSRLNVCSASLVSRKQGFERPTFVETRSRSPDGRSLQHLASLINISTPRHMDASKFFDQATEHTARNSSTQHTPRLFSFQEAWRILFGNHKPYHHGFLLHQNQARFVVCALKLLKYKIDLQMLLPCTHDQIFSFTEATSRKKHNWKHVQ